jgi:hypothetical protein
MHSIIRRFNNAPLEDKILRANPAQPPKGKTGAPRPAGAPGMHGAAHGPAAGGHGPGRDDRRPRGGKNRRKDKPAGTPSAFAEELAKAL